MKTAMQELIVHLEMLKSRVDMADIDSLIEYANEKFETEKKELILAFYEGVNEGANIGIGIKPYYKNSGEEYYNQTYNQNK